MHPKNPYKNQPDFKQLAIDYPEFRKYVKQDLAGKVKLDFQNKEALLALTTILLRKDFSIDFQMPSHKLVPTLPLRLNYILWIEDLLKNCNIPVEGASGIDIGSGASCIYGLLAAKMYSWKMLATEIDIESIEYARGNVNRNNFKHLLTVKEVKEDVFLDGALEGNTEYDFCMCNPPFFETESELDMRNKSRTEERPPPRNAHTGTLDELVSHGGEFAFVSSIIKDSIELKERIKIYTSMIGQKKNVGILLGKIKEAGALSMTKTEFRQGRTTRWGIAWTFTSGMLKDVKAKLGYMHVKKKGEIVRSHNINKLPGTTFEEVKQNLLRILDDLKVKVDSMKLENIESFGANFTATINTWCRSYRRKEKQRLEALKKAQDEEESSKVTSDSKESLKRPAQDSKLSQVEPKRAKVLPFLVGSIYLYDNKDSFNIGLLFLEGTGGRDAINSFLQCLVNHFKC